jgi:sterol desaturase/sphingolipid hydroxylase (fatty acid hydroxylase superfamily)
MRRSSRWHDLHWPHLLLLAALLPTWHFGSSIPAAGLLGGWLALNLASLAVAERLWPHRQDWHPTRGELVRDGGTLGMNAAVDGAIKALLTLIAAEFALEPTLALAPWVAVIAGVLIAELGSYTLHRLSHEGGWLWRVHLLHHRPTRLHVANALTAHPINAAYDGLARLLPLVLLGFDAATLQLITMFHLTQALVSHANVRGHIGPLRWLIGGAELHRLHHSVRDEEAGNFGTDVPFWDLLIGTYRHGPAPRMVGPFNERAYPAPEQWGRLLAWPFLPLLTCQRCQRWAVARGNSRST